MTKQEATAALAESLRGKTVAAKFPAESPPHMVDWAVGRLQLRRRLLAGELAPEEIARLARLEYQQAVAALEWDLGATAYAFPWGCEIAGIVYHRAVPFERGANFNQTSGQWSPSPGVRERNGEILARSQREVGKMLAVWQSLA